MKVSDSLPVLTRGAEANLLKVIERAIVAVTLAGSLIGVANLGAQQLPNPATAPKPAQIFSARKIFISNTSGECDFYCGAPDQPYNELYTGMKTWGQYELVPAPSDADLVFEIHFVPMRDGQLARVRLVFVDPKTHVTLWTLDERVEAAARQATGRKNFDKAMSTLIQDVEKLSTPPSGMANAQPASAPNLQP